MSDVSVSKKYSLAVKQLHQLENTTGRKDAPEYQQQLALLIAEFVLIKRIVDLLALFSSNENISEVSTNYVPFLNVDYYLAMLYGWVQPPKTATLQKCKTHFIQYIQLLDGYGLVGGIYKQWVDRTSESKPLVLVDYADWESSTKVLSPMERRQLKIETHREIKSLSEKLAVLDEKSDDGEENDIMATWDEDTVRAVYLDQIRLHVLLTFNQLESTLMELELLQNAPPPKPSQDGEEEQNSQRERKDNKEDPTGYTDKVETLPWKKQRVSDLISKQGKILQPFTIVSNRNQIREKVFGTGQTLPSMTVEEYLDYELANGKLMRDEVKDKPKDGYDTDAEDEEEEIKNRLWDDWKDDNPKGSGNMKSNIG